MKRASMLSDPDTTNNRDGITTIVSATSGPQADLGITLTSSPEPVPVNHALTLAMAVANGGPSDATSVVVTYTSSIPLAQVAIETITPSQGRCSPPVGHNPVTCQLGTLASRETATITITAFPAVRGPLISTATVAATESDPDSPNNMFTAFTAFTTLQ